LPAEARCAAKACGRRFAGVLGAFGWNVTIVLAKEWYENPDGVLDRLLAML